MATNKTTLATVRKARREKLAMLREQQEATNLAIDIAHANAALAMLPYHGHDARQSLREGWGDIIDPLEWMKDDPFFAGMQRGPFTSPGGREHGRDRPLIDNENELRSIRQSCRWIADTTPTAKCALKNLTNFVIGKGYEVKTVAADAQKPSDQLLGRVKWVVDTFIDDNDFQGGLDRELFRRDVRDGEFLVALYNRGGGRVAARTIEPEQITEPSDARALEDQYGYCDTPGDWTFGIHTAAGDVQTIYGYHVQWNAAGNDFDYLPECRIVHSKRNVDRNVKRGLSDFYAVEEDLLDHGKLARNMRKGASIQAAIAYFRKHAQGTTKSQIEQFQADRANQTITRQTSAGTRTRVISSYEAGSVVDIPRGMDLEKSPIAGEAAGAFVEILQAAARVIGANWCMPEYMISGDASNNNYASALVAESPFVKNCEAEQVTYKKKFAELFWKVLRIAWNAGAFYGLAESFEQIEQQIEIDIEPPQVASRNATEETNRRSLLNEKGVMSKSTWAAQEGLDYDQEQENINNARPETPMGGDGLPVDSQGSALPANGSGNDTQPTPTPSGSEAVQDTALNGAQIASLLQVTDQVRVGQLPKPAAIEILRAAFPLMNPERIAKIVNAIEVSPTPAPLDLQERKRRYP